MDWPMDHNCKILVNSQQEIFVWDPPWSSINRQNIVESPDVYFDYKVEANQNVYKVEWNKNVRF